jgi:cytochrome c oxidase accessory protein FixG
MTNDNDQSPSPQSSGIQVARGDVPYYVEHGLTHPRAVFGMFRKIKTSFMVLLLAFFHLAPFIRWDRGPGAPDQAILIDMAGRRAYAFFIEIWPQEVYYLTGLLMVAGLTLFTMSAMAGRLWCGFLCWQTVYTDLFVMVQRAVVGDRSKMLEFSRQKWSLNKFLRLAILNAIWLAIGLSTGIAFVLYFGDAFQELRAIFTGQASDSSYIFIGVVGGFCFLLGAYAREHVCVYVCPYSRFQTAMLDEHSLVVTYEAWRGEPRGPHRKDETFEGRGHCIDCKACVMSCPTGIDIRFGNQLACIGCGLCIDACNDMMDRVGLPRGLISYESDYNIKAKEQGKPTAQKVIRPRTVTYLTLIGVVGAALLFTFITRARTAVDVLHERAPLYVQTKDGGIRNGYTLKVLNMERKTHTYTLTTEGVKGATLSVIGGENNATTVPLEADPDSVATFRIYVASPPNETLPPHADLTFVLTTDDGHVVKKESLFAGP